MKVLQPLAGPSTRVIYLYSLDPARTLAGP
jgi:hypothetical protein